VSNLKLKKATNLQDSKAQGSGLTFALEGKLPFLIIFAVLYGLVFINYIDVMTPGGSDSGYHLWLALMYFLPFVGFSMFNVKNWRITLGLGLIASLMNDLFFGPFKYLIGYSYNIAGYYHLWLIPQNSLLFHMNLGFAVIPVQSWMMSASIYLRIAATCLLLNGRNFPFNSLQLRRYVLIKRRGIGTLNRAVEKPVDV
jgi:hypothetical protein